MQHTGWMVAAVVAATMLSPASTGPGALAQTTLKVEERHLLDNDRVMVIDFTFPPGFRGEEHAAVADEFAYVLDGEFTVVTRGRGRRVVRKGEIEYATKDTVHTSLNEGKRPARVLVVIVKP